MPEISVPKGGGALTGIGETFQPDLHTGTGNLTVPIPLPPGRGAPTLSLSYSSGAGNGPYGLGWSLAVPKISRRTDRGVPSYDDRADIFVLSGAEELVPVPLGNAAPADLPAGATATRYRPRTESAFARIVHVVGPSDDYWDIWSHSGLRNRYGTPRPFGGTTDWTDPASVRAPSGPVFSWLLTTSTDPLGNTTTYRYRDDGGAQRYLDTVSYADYGDPTAPSYAVTLTVTYSDQTAPRPDPFSDRRPGFELRTSLRARRISVSTVGDGDTPPTLVDLSYADETPGREPASGISLLTSIQVTGQDGTTGEAESLPPLTFEYRPWSPATRRFRRLPAILPPVALGPGFELIDLFGDGLPSILQLNGSARYWRNRGDGRFDPPRPMRFAPGAAELGTPGVQLGDIDADGRPELTVTAGGRTTVWSLATPPPGSDQASFEPTPRISTVQPNLDTGSAQVRLLDLDGDHIPDLLIAGEHPLAARGDGRGGFGPFRRIEGTPPLADLTNSHVLLADMTGDGLTDVVEAYDGAVRYWPSLGRGRFGPPVTMTDSPRFTDPAADRSTSFDPRRLMLGDVTGDGSADVLYVGEGTVTIWANRSGNGFAPPVVIQGTPPVDSRTAVRIADLDGIGVGGLLWTGLGPKGEWAFLDLTGGAKPYLLTDVDNHCGAVTTLTWSTSTAFATADRLVGRPWRTPLPFPVHVIAGSRTEDRFAQTVLTSAYRYSDGYWDPTDREFRGFGRVVQTDSQTAVSPPPAAQPTLTPLDPLTPSAPVPPGFDAATAGNLLRNWSFDTAGVSTPTTLATSAAQPLGSADAAAQEWTARNTSPATTYTDVVPSDLPQGAGGKMLHVITDGAGCGVEQTLGGTVGDPGQVVSSVWVKVVRGAVQLGTGDGPDIPADATLEQTGDWILASTGNQWKPTGRMSVTATHPGGAEFYLDHAWARVPDVPAEPVDGPPVRTVTWFALGPVGPSEGVWTAVDPTDEYWPGDPLLRPHMDFSALPESLPRPTLRETLRAVRGRVLRREVYADDGDPVRGTLPFEVHDAAFAVVPVLDGRNATDPTWLAQPVLAVQAIFSRDATWDRGDEPMIRLFASGRFDDYGRAHAAAELGVPRGRDPRTAGEPCLGTATTTDFATRDDAGLYMLDRVTRAARYEVTDTGTVPVLDLLANVLGADPTGEPRSLQLTYYDGAAFAGLQLGQLGDHGLPTRVEQLVLTPDRLAQIGAAAVTGGTGAPAPPYLAPDGSTLPGTEWPGTYPAEFRNAVLTAPAERGTHAGYVWHDAAGQLVAGYYAQASRNSYDVHTPAAGKTPRGMLLVARDAFGGDTTTTWDTYDLLPVATIDAAGLTTTASNDYRILKANLITDPNGNRTAVGYTSLGLPAWIAALGRAGRSEGDTVEQPGQKFVYDFAAYDRSLAGAGDPQPMSVTGVRRVDHRWTIVDKENARRASVGEPPLTANEIASMFGPTEEEQHPERFIRTTEFTDGLARLLQTRTQADDLAIGNVGLPEDLSAAAPTITSDTLAAGPAVVVSGWKIYGNKGQSMVAFEPFRDTGWAYTPPTAARLAGLAAVRQHRDARGRPTVTVGPDGSQSRVVRGRPNDLADPDSAVPTPWETWTYGAEDNAGRTHPTESLDRCQHWNTPGSAIVDALGRTVQTVQRGLAQEVVTRTVYDIDGHAISAIDPLNRQIAATMYDLVGRVWTSWLLDSGTRRTVHDALGGTIEHRDDKGAVVFSAYDRAHRAVWTWAADRPAQAPTLRQVNGYGDDPLTSGLSPDQALAANGLGRIVSQYDEAGRVRTDGYDLDGHPTRTVRRVLKYSLLLSALPASGAWEGTAYAVDWQTGPGEVLADRSAALLDATDYALDLSFDALGRRTATTAPLDTTGTRAQISFAYGRGGGVTAVTVDGMPHLQQVVYDAHGRRSLALLGNGVLVRYGYSARTLRLRRLRAEHASDAAADGTMSWTCDGPVLQDHTFRHDRTGRLLTLGDRTPRCGVAPTPDRLDRQFSYDALGRLVSATGRETDVAPVLPWTDAPRSADVTKARGYTDTYEYDMVGNMLSLAHRTDVSGTGAYARTYGVRSGSNQLSTLTAGGLAVQYTQDACGNLVTEATNRFFEWDAADRLATFRDQAGTSQPSVYAQYRYDAAGHRVVKVVRRSAGPDLVTVYVGGFERVLSGAVDTNLTAYDEVHLTDGGARLATVRRGPVLPDDPLPQPVVYQLGDRLSSVTATLAPDGSVLSREDYTPYGETSFGSYARKRYRFHAKERDEESSLAHHGARSYAPWLARWASPDPLGIQDGPNLYAFVRGDPVNGTDSSGFQTVFGNEGRYQALETQPGHTREHIISGCVLQYGFEETYGKEMSDALASRTYANAHTVILPNSLAGPKTRLDLSHAAELRSSMAKGQPVELRNAYLRSVQNMQAGGKLSPADLSRTEQIAAREVASWVKAEGVAREAAAGIPIPKVLAKRLTPPASAAPTPAPATRVPVTSFPKKESSSGPSLGGPPHGGSIERGFRFNPAAELGELGRAVPFVAEAEAALQAGDYLAGMSKLTAPLAGPLGTAARVLPVAAGVGVVGAVVGHAARYGAEKAGASSSTAQGIGLGSAALAGAALGSLIIPGVGTAAGALIGGVAAAAMYYWTAN